MIIRIKRLTEKETPKQDHCHPKFVEHIYENPEQESSYKDGGHVATIIRRK